MLLLWLLILMVSLFFLLKSSDFLVYFAEKIGVHLKLNPLLIGVLLLAFGTSLPELITSIISIFQKSSEIISGNIIGSNIANLLLVLGVCALFSKKFKVTSNQKSNFDLLMFIVSTIFLTIIILDGQIIIYEAIFGLLLFLFYVIKTIHKKKLPENILVVKKKLLNTKIEKKSKLDFRIILGFIFSLILLYFSAEYIIKSVIEISILLNVGKEVIAASAIALGTSLPEVMVSLTAVKKKKYSMALGNVLGSNIFNAFLVIGIAGLFGKIFIPLNMMIVGISFLILATLSYFAFANRNKMNFFTGSIMILLYLVFIMILFY